MQPNTASTQQNILICQQTTEFHSTCMLKMSAYISTSIRGMKQCQRANSILMHQMQCITCTICCLKNLGLPQPGFTKSLTTVWRVALLVSIVTKSQLLRLRISVLDIIRLYGMSKPRSYCFYVSLVILYLIHVVFGYMTALTGTLLTYFTRNSMLFPHLFKLRLRCSVAQHFAINGILVKARY